MNLGRHHVFDGRIHQLVPADPAQPGKRRGLDLDCKVSGSVAGAWMAGMQGAVVPHGHGRWLKRRLQAIADYCYTSRAQGSTCMKGRTSCDWNTLFVT